MTSGAVRPPHAVTVRGRGGGTKRAACPIGCAGRATPPLATLDVRAQPAVVGTLPAAGSVRRTNVPVRGKGQQTETDTPHVSTHLPHAARGAPGFCASGQLTVTHTHSVPTNGPTNRTKKQPTNLFCVRFAAEPLFHTRRVDYAHSPQLQPRAKDVSIPPRQQVPNATQTFGHRRGPSHQPAPGVERHSLAKSK